MTGSQRRSERVSRQSPRSIASFASQEACHERPSRADSDPSGASPEGKSSPTLFERPIWGPGPASAAARRGGGEENPKPNPLKSGANRTSLGPPGRGRGPAPHMERSINVGENRGGSCPLARHLSNRKRTVKSGHEGGECVPMKLLTAGNSAIRANFFARTSPSSVPKGRGGSP